MKLVEKRLGEITRVDFFGADLDPIIPGGVYYLDVNDEGFNRPYIALPDNSFIKTTTANAKKFVRVTSSQYSFFDIPLGLNGSVSFAATNDILSFGKGTLSKGGGDVSFPRWVPAENMVHPLILDLIFRSAYRSVLCDEETYEKLISDIVDYCRRVEEFKIPTYAKIHDTSKIFALKNEKAGKPFVFDASLPELIKYSLQEPEKPEVETPVVEEPETPTVEQATPVTPVETSESVDVNDAPKKLDRPVPKSLVRQLPMKGTKAEDMKISEAKALVKVCESYTMKHVLTAMGYRSSSRVSIVGRYRYAKQMLDADDELEKEAAVSVPEEEPSTVHTTEETSETQVVVATEETKVETPVVEEPETPTVEQAAPVTPAEDEVGKPAAYSKSMLYVECIDIDEIDRFLDKKYGTPNISGVPSKFSLSMMRTFIQMDKENNSSLLSIFSLKSKSQVIRLRGKILNELDARNESAEVTVIPHPTDYFSPLEERDVPSDVYKVCAFPYKSLQMSSSDVLLFLTDLAKYPAKLVQNQYDIDDVQLAAVTVAVIDIYNEIKKDDKIMQRFRGLK